MDKHWFRVPAAVCYVEDMHFLRRRQIPIFEYLQDVLHCWSSQRGANRYLAERAILRAIKVAGILKSVRRMIDLRCFLLEHKRLACRREIGIRERWVKKTGEIKYGACRLDPTVKVLAVIGGSLVACKGNHFRRRYAYREGSYDCTSIRQFVMLAKQPLPHDSEQNALTDEATLLGGDDPRNRIRDALEVLERQDGCGGDHVRPNVANNRPA